MTVSRIIEPLCWTILFALGVATVALVAGYNYGLSQEPVATTAPSPQPTQSLVIETTSTCSSALCARVGALLNVDVACPREHATLPYSIPCIYRDLYPQCVVGVCTYVGETGTCILPEHDEYDAAARAAIELEEFDCDCHCS